MLAHPMLPGRTRRVLVVDDQPEIRALLKRILAQVAGADSYTVDTAANAEDALRLLEAHEYAVLLSDLRMPGADGASLLREARQRWPGMPCAIMTGFADDERAMEATARGDAETIIPKPWRIVDLLVTLDALARASQPTAPPEV